MPAPRHEQCVGTILELAGDAVGKVYIEKYFPSESKEKVRLCVAADIMRENECVLLSSFPFSVMKRQEDCSYSNIRLIQ